MAELSLIVSGLLTLVFLTLALYPGKRLNVPRVGKNPGFLGLRTSAAKREFAHEGHRLVERGCREVKYLNENH